MNLKEYLETKKVIQKNIITFIDQESDIEENFKNVINAINNNKICDQSDELRSLLHFIVNISNNHNRLSNFYQKIERILSIFISQIKNYFLNEDLFNIFKSNKRLLLFLIEEKMITIDPFIINAITKEKYVNAGYLFYFFNEIKNCIEIELKEKIEKEINMNDFDSFKEKRKLGENDTHICYLIRNDLIDEFITFVNHKSLALSISIEFSFYETNSFLIKNKPSLIQYAAFFGSIQIFKYLYLNKAEVDELLWIYSIHSRNPEIIHFLEEQKFKLSENLQFDCLIECIKCHHNEMAHYISENYIKNDLQNEDDADFITASIKAYNYTFFPAKLDNTVTFYDLCHYDHVKLVKMLSESKNFKNTKIILKQN